MSDLSEADVEAIRALSEVHCEGLVSHDPEVFLSACTDDVTFIPPDEDVVSGREAVRTYLQDFPRLNDMELDIEEVEGSGDIAFSRGTTDMTMDDGTRGSGKWMAIHRRTDAGWKMARDTWTLIE